MQSQIPEPKINPLDLEAALLDIGARVAALEHLEALQNSGASHLPIEWKENEAHLLQPIEGEVPLCFEASMPDVASTIRIWVEQTTVTRAALCDQGVQTELLDTAPASLDDLVLA